MGAAAGSDSRLMSARSYGLSCGAPGSNEPVGGAALLRMWTQTMMAAAAIGFVMTVAQSPQALAATPEIGDAVTVKSSVSAEMGGAKRELSKGAKVHQDEALVTGSNASAEIELLDKTKLAVGPSARIVLDKFIYDASASPASISINLAKGAFRFITGTSDKAAYQIKTPTASMGVRGTIFDVFVADNGEAVVLLHEGSIDVCPTPASCRRHDRLGQIMHIGLGGVLSTPLRWQRSLLRGIKVGRAFPFVGRRLAIDPVRRLTHAALLGGGADRIITAPLKGLRSIEKALPSIRLP